MRRSAIIGIAVGLCSVLAISGSAFAACVISGPAEVSASQSFTLCGPSGNGYRYEWYGPGISSNTLSRCVTVAGRPRGTYEYLLVVSVNGQELDRCRSVVNVGGATGGVESCAITGPTTIESGGTVELCATGAAILHSYSWEGPNGFTASTRCITASDEGTYILTTRNPITGSTRQCTQRVDLVGGNASSNCGISGPDVIASGQTVQLCGPSRSNVTYQWRGPGTFSSASRCVTASRTGSYTLVVRNRSTGYTETCTQVLSYYDNNNNGSGDDDADAIVSGNCPKGMAFWRRQCSTASRTFSSAELRSIAQRIDQESSYFNWSDDLTGFCQALSPTGPLTQRKRAAREYAALLANVIAGEYGATSDDGTQVGLDRDTDVNYVGVSTLGDLIVRADQMFVSGRGNFNRLSQTLHAINNGVGIGPVCE